MDYANGLTKYALPGALINMLLNGHPFHLEVTPQPEIPAAQFGAKMDGRDNTDAFMRAHDEVMRQGGGFVRIAAGESLVNCMPHDPRCRWRGAGRTATRLTLADGQPALADSGFGARRNAMFYVLARARAGSVVTLDSYHAHHEDMLLLGNKAGQINPIDLIGYENAQHDPDYGTHDIDSYSSGTLRNVEISGGSGAGIYVGPQRHRGYVHHTRSVSNEQQGYYCLANDNLVGERTGFGGNKGHQVHFAGQSGSMIAGANIWGIDSADRSNSCLGLVFQNCNDAGALWNVIQETIVVNGSTNLTRGITIMGNMISPHGAVFTSNGVPKGTADASYNAHIHVDDMKMVSIVGNAISAGNNPRYTYNYMLWADDAAGVLFDQLYSSEVNVKPFALAPVHAINGAVVAERLTNIYKKVRTQNGAAALGWDSSTDITSVLTDQAIALNPQVMAGPLWLYDSFGGVEGQSTRFIDMVNGGSTTITSTRRQLIFNVAVGGYTVTLPAMADTLMAREITLMFRAAVGTFTLAASAGDTLDFVPPAAVVAGQRLDLVFQPSTRKWILTLNETV